MNCRRVIWILIFLALACISLVLVGCSMIPHEKSTAFRSANSSELDAAYKATIERTVTGQVQQPVNIRVDTSGSNNNVRVESPQPIVQSNTVRVTSSQILSDERGQRITAESKYSIPIWVNLAGFGLAILVVLFAVNRARQAYPAINAAVGAGDEFMRRQIDKYRTRASSTTDPSVMAEANATAYQLEKERAEFVRKHEL